VVVMAVAVVVAAPMAVVAAVRVVAAVLVLVVIVVVPTTAVGQRYGSTARRWGLRQIASSITR